MIPKKYDLEETVLVEARLRIEKLATEYRDKVLVPFCRKHRLTYLAGMGRTVFYTSDDRSFGSAADAVCEGYPQAEAVFEVLDQGAVGQNDCFGFYVGDITYADIGLPPFGEPKR